MQPDPKLRFISFRPDLAPSFKAINQEWITEMFELEASDMAILEHPQSKVIDAGGQIWFAEHVQRGIVGCCALMPQEGGTFELTKMGVLKNTRGLKVGERLLQHVLTEAKQMPIKRLFLLTNKDCKAAIHLYQRNGFEHDESVLRQYGCSYSRCDVGMRYGPIWQKP